MLTEKDFSRTTRLIALCLSGAILALLSASMAAARPISGVTFNNPRINGIPVDHCLHWAQQCGQPAADTICSRQGLGRAVYFERNPMPQTFVIGDGKICKGNCDAFTVIVCDAGNDMSNANKPDRDPYHSGAILAQLESMSQCKHVGGPASNTDYYVCDVKFSLLNTTGKEIFFASGKSQNQIPYSWGNDRAGAPHDGKIGYPYGLKPGKKMILGNRCIIPHGRSTGALQLAGSGHHYGDSNKHRFKWSLAITCPQ